MRAAAWSSMAMQLALCLVWLVPEARAQPAPQPYPPPAPQPYPPPASQPYPPPAPQPYPQAPPYAQPPPYPQPHPYAQPQPQPPPKPSGPPPVVYGWDPDVPAPDGYHLSSDPNGTLIGAGVALLTIGWVTSSVAAAVGGSLENQETALEQDEISADDWTPLYIPIAGPAVAIATLKPRPAGVGLLVADAIMQLAGLVGIVAGSLDERHKAVRTKLGGVVEIELTPSVGSTGNGLGLHGRF